MQCLTGRKVTSAERSGQHNAPVGTERPFARNHADRAMRDGPASATLALACVMPSEMSAWRTAS